VVVGRTGFARKKRPLVVPASPMKQTGMHGALREMLRFLRTGQRPQAECQDNIRSLAMVFGAVESAGKGRRLAIVV
jgi:hypothetical protein